MKRITWALAFVALLTGACGDSSSGTTVPSTATTAPAAATTAPAAATTAPAAATTAPATTAPGGYFPPSPSVMVNPSALGDHLTDDAGNTLYVFLPDNQGESTCYDQCADNWPALAAATAGSGAEAALVGTTTRTDGTSQATYNGWPLYRFAADQAPGDTTGQGIGDNWYVVDPAGEPIK